MNVRDGAARAVLWILTFSAWANAGATGQRFSGAWSGVAFLTFTLVGAACAYLAARDGAQMRWDFARAVEWITAAHAGDASSLIPGGASASRDIEDKASPTAARDTASRLERRRIRSQRFLATGLLAAGALVLSGALVGSFSWAGVIVGCALVGGGAVVLTREHLPARQRSSGGA